MILNSNGGMVFDGVEDSNLPRNLEHAYMLLERHKEDGILLLEGGIDIDPALYGEVPHRLTYARDHTDPTTRDYREIALFRKARELNMWIFGICRGHQLMAALMGGTLYQDLSLYEGGKERRHGGGHAVALYGVGIDIFGRDEENNAKSDVEFVNSMHHQAVKDVPSSATVIARHASGLVEGLYYPERRMLSVQWHPEVMNDTRAITWIRQQQAKSAASRTQVLLTETSESGTIDRVDIIV